MGKKKKTPEPVDPPVADQTVSLDPGDDGIMQTDAHVEGHGTHD
jgi:hypothetical protein